MNRITIKRDHKNHPWIFSNEILSKENSPLAGDIVEIYRGKKFISRGFYNPNSLIAVRKFPGWGDFNFEFVKESILTALLKRRSILTDDSFRVVFAESDGLPGLIIDKYNDHYVIQIHSFGIDRRKDLVIDALQSFSAVSITEKSDEYFRKLEGLTTNNGLIFGAVDELIEINQDGIRLMVDIQKGQKTGFFFDLRDIRRRVRDLSKNKTILDLCCYTGGFSLYAAGGGASKITGVDSSKHTIEMAKENAKINNSRNIHFELYDVFRFLRESKEKYDIIILDPPSFTRSKKEIQDAKRGYRELNIQAMKHLEKGGILVTTSCSYHMGRDDFLSILMDSANDASVNLTIIEEMKQSFDHPILLNMPESYYLKAFVLARAS